MRCRVGDLVVVVRTTDNIDRHLIGRVLTVTQVFDHEAWICCPQLISDDGRLIAWLDANLRPLRPSAGVDEMLRIAGHPLSQSHREKVGA